MGNAQKLSTRTVSASLFAFAIGLMVALSLGVGTQNAYAATELAANDAEGGSGVSVQAQKNLKQSGIKFDIKKNKKRAFYMGLKNAGKVKYTVKVSKVKIKNAKKKGYKQAVFDVDFALKSGPSRSQQKKVLKLVSKGYGSDDWTTVSPGIFWYAVDYNTGQQLEHDNDFGVKAKQKRLKKDAVTKKYKSSDGSWFTLYKSGSIRVTVTYPESYKGLCLVCFGGMGFGGMGSTEKGFEKSSGKKMTLQETAWFKHAKTRKNMHGIRIY